MDIIKNGTEEEQRRLIDDIAKRLETKRYGLVWERGGDDEDSPFSAEDVVIENTNGLPYPVFREDLSVSPSKANGDMLLEGDNFIWLNILEQTHKGMIDVIYIDPPYNTGNKDFKYNDEFVDPNDIFKHSKWLDFMYKRITVAKRLLKPDGLIFISCDDREQAPLKLLCDEIFGPTNFINNIAVKTAEPTGVKMAHVSKRLPKIKEYVLIYSVDADRVEFNDIRVPKDEWDPEYKMVICGLTQQELHEIMSIRDNEQRGDDDIDRVDELLAKATCKPIADIYKEENIVGDENKKAFNFNNAWRIFRTVSVSGGAKKIADQKKPQMSQVFFCITTPQKKMYFIKGDYNDDTPNPRSKIIFAVDYLTINPCDFWADIRTTGLASEGGVEFLNGKKPQKLLQRLLDLANNPDAIVLDFFAGSGSTAEAVLRQNKEDGGHRQWILITNNEDQDEDDGDPETGICRDITKPRIDNVITGTKADGTHYGDGYDSGYAYYQYDFLPRTPYREKNARSFQRPAVLDPFVAIKYGAHKIATDEETMAYAYQGKDNIIVLAFGQATREDIDQTLEGLDIDETLPVVAIVPDGCPLDMKHQDDLEVIPFSKLTDNSYLQGRK